MKEQLELFFWKSYFSYLKKKMGIISWHATLSKPYNQFTTKEKIGIWHSHCQSLKNLKNLKKEDEIDLRKLF